MLYLVIPALITTSSYLPVLCTECILLVVLCQEHYEIRLKDTHHVNILGASCPEAQRTLVNQLAAQQIRLLQNNKKQTNENLPDKITYPTENKKKNQMTPQHFCMLSKNYHLNFENGTTVTIKSQQLENIFHVSMVRSHF